MPVGASAVRGLLLSNAGQRPLALVRLTSTSSVFLVESGPTSIDPGGQLTVNVRFLPTRLGPAVGELSIESDAEDHPGVEIALLGTGGASSPCDDGNSCTDDTEDPGTGQCAHAPRSGRCHDGSVCTQNDRCQAETCVGEAVVCDDGIPCTQDVCDPASGCGAVPDHLRCDDQDPCTFDRCEAGGCQNPTAPDGQACGEVLSCVHQDRCEAGRCVRQAIVEGSPCSDEDRCTLDDRCSQGACVGTATRTPSTVLGTTWSIGDVAAASFAEGHLYVTPDEVTSFPRLQILAESAGTWAPIAAGARYLFGDAHFYSLGGQRYGRVVNTTTSRDRVEVLDLSAPLRPRLIAARTLATRNEVAVGLAEDQLYFCGPGGLGSVDLSDPNQPGVAVQWPSAVCQGAKSSGGGFLAAWSQAEQPGAEGGVDTIGTLRIERLGRNGPVEVLNHTFTVAQTMPVLGVDSLGPILRVSLNERRLVAELANFNRFLVVDLEAATPSAVLVDLSALGRSDLAGVAEAVAYLNVDHTLRAVDLTDPLQPLVLGYTLPLSAAMVPVTVLDRAGERLALRANNGRLLVVPRVGTGVVAPETVRGQGVFEHLYASSAGLIAVSISGAQLVSLPDLAAPTIQNAPLLQSPWFEGAGFTEATLIDGPDGPLGVYTPRNNRDPDHLTLPSVQLSSDGATTLGPVYRLEGRPLGEALSGIAFDGCWGLALGSAPAELLLLDRCVSANPDTITSQPFFDAVGRVPCSQRPVERHGGGYFSVAFQDAVVWVDLAVPSLPRAIEVPWSPSASTCITSTGLAVDGERLATLDDFNNQSRLRVFDLSGATPTLLRSTAGPLGWSGVWLHADRAYLGQRSLRGGAVEVLDLRPDPPLVVESWNLPGSGVLDLLPHGGLLYSASPWALNVIEPGCEGP